ncbi:MAG: response regulator transcription factor [Rhodospirillales bacterium]|nr:response regulator transcription factor [Rhodospirillales bacterium]
MRALIADRKPLIREALAALIRTRLPRFDVATAATLSDGTMLMGRAPFGVLILESAQVAGDRLLDAIRLIHPGWRVVLMSQDAAEDTDAGTTRACDAFWHAGTDGETMVGDILRLTGARATSLGVAPTAMPAAIPAPALLPPIAAVEAEAEPAPAGRGLTRRQQDVLGLLSEGRSTKEIARSLNLGVGTIKAHLDGLYRTLGVHNRTAAVSLARRMPAMADNVIRLESRPAPRPRAEAGELAAQVG